MHTRIRTAPGAGRAAALLALTVLVAGTGAGVTARAAGGDDLRDAGHRPDTSGMQTCVDGMHWNSTMPPCPEPTVVVDDQTVKVVLALDDSEFFGSDRATLNAASLRHLSRLVRSLHAADGIHAVRITGHADRIGPEPYNEQLALQRANNVKTFLVNHGIPGGKIVATGEGLQEPWVTCPAHLTKREPAGCLAPNRRVDIEVVYDDDIKLTHITVIPPPE
jgi:outer membrane protein OmpA-like peptidoglycan-associated protein